MTRAEIIAVGSELLVGGCVDTNSLFLSRGLEALGIDVRFKSIVGDDEDDIATAVSVATRRADVILLTGGLGPTSDDCTRTAVARATGCPLRRRTEAFNGLSARLAAWNRKATDAQLEQTLIPAGARVLPNPIGSAPGFCFQWNGCFIAALPGVPGEARAMFETTLATHLVSDKLRIERRVLHTVGLFESDIDRRVRNLMRTRRGVRFGLLASPLGVTISFSAPGDSGRSALMLDRLVQLVKRRLAPHVYAEGDETMEEVVGRQLLEHGLMLAVAESCTGGLIGHRLTNVPGSSTYFERGVVSYSNEAKHETLGVPESSLRRYGAVSAQVAAAMAKGIRLRSRADIGLSVTGIAGPGGGSSQKPVGLVYVGMDASRAGRSLHQTLAVTKEFRFHGDRHTIKLRSSQAALNMVRLWLSELDRREPR